MAATKNLDLGDFARSLTRIEEERTTLKGLVRERGKALEELRRENDELRREAEIAAKRHADESKALLRQLASEGGKAATEIADLTARLEAESAERERLQERLDQLEPIAEAVRQAVAERGLAA